MKIIFQTERLTLREFNLDDADFIIALLNSPGWLKNIGDRKVKTIEDAKNYLLNGPMKSYVENGFGLWMIEKTDDKSPIGMSGLIKRDFLEHIDIGYALMPQYMGQGYAYEIAQAIMDYTKNVLQKEKVMAITLPSNQPSVSLLGKIGLKLKETMISPYTNEELLVFIG